MATESQGCWDMTPADLWGSLSLTLESEVMGYGLLQRECLLGTLVAPLGCLALALCFIRLAVIIIIIHNATVGPWLVLCVFLRIYMPLI